MRSLGNSLSGDFDPYRRQYPARRPILTNQFYDDEQLDLSGAEDVWAFCYPPLPLEHLVVADPFGPTRDEARYLWLITETDILISLERGETGRKTSRGRLAHTNLSGGALAHAGGELWISGDSRIWLTGGSGRYPCQSATELDVVVSVFRAAGFVVCAGGWDAVANRADRSLVNVECR